jgi:glycosyltransferase involved in cell wall biosynthesis
MTVSVPAAVHVTLPVTVVIPARNEAINLPGCLARLKRFAKVVVVDSNSGDETPAIARDHGADIVAFDWDGKFPKKRNWLLLNRPPQTPWVLFLDADEQVSETFCDELSRTLGSTDCKGFWLNYTNHFRGRMLKFGVPQRKLALFRVGAGLYERIEEDHWSSLDMEVHEHPVIEGKIGEIAARIDHRDDQGLEKFLRRHIDYAKWEARRYCWLAAGGNGGGVPLTARQQFKYRHLAKWWYPAFYFSYAYFLRLGILDGAAGLHYAYYKAWYFHTIRLLIADLRQQAKTGSG